MKEQFIVKRIRKRKRQLIDLANEIIAEYLEAGFVLTLRQLYYQFVARNLLPNTDASYKALGIAISDGCLLGLIDWEAIEDRTRGIEGQFRMRSPKHGVEILREEYHIDMWVGQPYRVEVWVEKEALTGVVLPVCQEYDLPMLACRGYVSQSEQWRAYRRFQATEDNEEQQTIILHLGDHDPSGIDMTRDNDDRLSLFLSTRQRLKYVHDQESVEVRRIALNMDQIKRYKPPPNPAEPKDSRYRAYKRRFGVKSWELDALAPEVIDGLIRDEVEDLIDFDEWAKRERKLKRDRRKLDKVLKQL